MTLRTNYFYPWVPTYPVPNLNLLHVNAPPRKPAGIGQSYNPSAPSTTGAALSSLQIAILEGNLTPEQAIASTGGAPLYVPDAALPPDLAQQAYATNAALFQQSLANPYFAAQQVSQQLGISVSPYQLGYFYSAPVQTPPTTPVPVSTTTPGPGPSPTPAPSTGWSNAPSGPLPPVIAPPSIPPIVPAATTTNPTLAAVSSWFTDPSQELISGVSNWMLVAGAGGVLLLLAMRK